MIFAIKSRCGQEEFFILYISLPLLAARGNPCIWNQPWHTPSQYPVSDKSSLEKILRICRLLWYITVHVSFKCTCTCYYRIFLRTICLGHPFLELTQSVTNAFIHIHDFNYICAQFSQLFTLESSNIPLGKSKSSNLKIMAYISNVEFSSTLQPSPDTALMRDITWSVIQCHHLRTWQYNMHVSSSLYVTHNSSWYS